MEQTISTGAVDLQLVRQRAAAFAASAPVLRRPEHATGLPSLIRAAEDLLARILARCKVVDATGATSPTARELLENSRLFDSALADVRGALNLLSEQPHVLSTGPAERSLPRGSSFETPHVVALSSDYLGAVELGWSQQTLKAYIAEIQAAEPLHLQEVLLLPPALKFALVQKLLDVAARLLRADATATAGDAELIARGIRSLREMSQLEWRALLEGMIAFDGLLRQDPAGVYERMDEESRNAYRLRVALIASRSDMSEMRVAATALELAREATGRAYVNPRLAARESHIGYYLVAEGFELLSTRAGYHPTSLERLRTFVRRHADTLYIGGIEVMTALLIAAVVLPLLPHQFEMLSVLFAVFLALIPASQGAVDLLNKIMTALLDARALPKLDFREGVPLEASTLVAVPTLLLNEKQVGDLFDTLEARYLTNVDPNIHFALLTDLPDSTSRPNMNDLDPLVELAMKRTENLNKKYVGAGGGSFLLLHRRRVFNPKQGVWMGWERKRGKLLDLNQLLAGRYDGFPVKVGDLKALARVKFVITLDSDTQLPRDTAHRLIGTMVHPLNRAIIDSASRIVTKGYGILQPRVGISVRSASASRFAAIYSGETGYDIYTRAVSDVYQDLYGEGIFTGKGIYEAGVLQEVLDRRFPRNALLSHDLVEGAYVRAGLVTDVEVIDDYPSHYSAHIRRNHRWVRGDWQIMRWLLPRVPDEQGQRVHNPISTISAWKIFDNMRRSLVEPLTFLLFVCGWLFLPGSPLYWTIATLIFLTLPVLTEFLFAIARMLLDGNLAAFPDAVRTLVSGLGFTLLNVIFLPHHAILQIDAVVRSLVRSLITGRRLLEWETAAESESSNQQSAADRYLGWMPVLAGAIGALLFYVHPPRLIPAAPILALWAISPLVTRWLNGRKYAEPRPLSKRENAFLRETALRTWRYFEEFGGQSNHYLIADHVEEDQLYQDRKISPTNLGLLLNARQAALELGYLTLPEFAALTEGSLATYGTLKRHRGHPLNWYDIETLEPLRPQIVSAVDSGNLAASLYSLHGGTLELLSRPLLSDALIEGISDCQQQITRKPSAHRSSNPSWREKVEWILSCEQEIAGGSNDTWSQQELARRVRAAAAFLRDCVPWLLPENASLLNQSETLQVPTLADAPAFARKLANRVQQSGEAAVTLRQELFAAADRLDSLVARVRSISDEAQRYADEMDFSFLIVPSRKLLSIGYEVETGKLYDACYDLLASEARTAVYIAVSKNDIPQESWFKLDRTHALVEGQPVLLSWTGTMFEYLMPALWMRSYPNALISRSLQAVPHIQRAYVKGIPWGISESAFAQRDTSGRYGYKAWGIPALALKYEAEDGPVISPYSTFLALNLDQEHALRNIQRMRSAAWFAEYGFYEAADYIHSRRGSRRTPEIVRSWMAHHQGMILLSITNRLTDQAFQRWFHLNARLRATELLLHEKPVQAKSLAGVKERKTKGTKPPTQDRGKKEPQSHT